MNLDLRFRISRFTIKRRVASALLLTLLLLVFLLPRPWAQEFYLNHSPFQALLCAVAAVCLVEAFAIRASAFDILKRIQQVVAAFVMFIGLLEIGQMFVGRRAAWSDFLINAAVVVLAIIALVAYRWQTAPPPRPDRAIAKRGMLGR
jgi:hypothetical protein